MAMKRGGWIMGPKIFAAILAVSMAIAGNVFAGPIDNARQFQEKAVGSSMRNSDMKAGKPGRIIINTDDKSIRTEGVSTSAGKEKAGKDKREAAPGR
jgi:hypothetical protein